MWSGADSTYLEAITAAGRSYTWHGTITDANGTTYSYTAGDIVQGSGQLSRMVSSANALDFGTVYTAELTMRLYLSIDRYTLYDGTITLYCDVDVDGTTYSVDMGVFRISSCSQELDSISITAYDDMMLMDETLVDTDQGEATPYDWIAYLAGLSGVTLGSTEDEISALPNGTSTLSFKETDDPLTQMSCRTALSYLCVCLGANAYIGRDGYLYIAAYNTSAVDDIAANERFSSSIADYVTQYTAVTLTVAVDGTVETFSTGDAGLTYDLGSNPWLQFDDEDDRASACESILNSITLIAYTPFTITAPLRPELDPMDVLTLSGNQASSDLGGITSITYKLSGAMTVKCSGGNPRLASATSSTQKAASSASRTASRKGLFYTYTNVSDIAIADGGTETVVSFTINSSSNSSVLFHAEIPHTVDTTESLDEDTYTYTENDCRITATYSINGDEMSYSPVFVEQDTDNVLHLLYYFTITARTSVVFEVNLTAENGAVAIDAGSVRACIYGDEIGSVGEYGSTISVAVSDDITDILTT